MTTSSIRKSNHHNERRSSSNNISRSSNDNNNNNNIEKLELENMHPLSRWQEPYHHDILTLFELNRNPRKAMPNPDSVRIRCPLNKLNAEFRCSICLDYMKNTMIVKECLHRFCASCIQKSIRVGKKECPTCRVHVPSRRSLRHDEKFDILVQGILKNTGLLDDEDEKDNNNHNHNNHKHSSSNSNKNTNSKGTTSAGSSSNVGGTTTTTGADVKTATTTIGNDKNGGTNKNNGNQQNTKRPLTLQQAIHEKNVGKSRVEEESNNNNNQKNNGLTDDKKKREEIKKKNQRRRIFIELRRHPKETKLRRLSRQCIHIDDDATISVIKLFLSKKVGPYAKNQFQVLSTHNGTRILLNDCLKLKNVYKNLSDDKIKQQQRQQTEECHSMVLHYRLAE